MPVPPIHLITPVWGEAYTRCFLDVAVPTLLAPGNLPALRGVPGSLYHIVTTEADRATIERSSVLPHLQACIPVRFTTIPEDVLALESRHRLQSYCYRQGVADADAIDAGVMFLNADVVFADGAIASLIRLASAGKRSVETLGIRLIKETVAPHLMQHHRAAGGAIVVSPRQLMALAMENLHPITRAHLYQGESEKLEPSGLMWRVGKEGLVAHCFHLHPIFVHAKIKNAAFTTTIDDDYVQSAQSDRSAAYVVRDSDEFCACELSAVDRQTEPVPRPPERDPSKVIAQWAFFNARPRHFELVKDRILLHAGRTNSASWRAVKRESKQAIREVFRHLAEPLELGLTDYEIQTVLQRRGLTTADLEQPKSRISRWFADLRNAPPRWTRKQA